MIGIEALVAGVIAALAIIGGLMVKARRDGRADEEREAMARDLNAIRKADEVDEAIAGRDIDANRKELGKWARR